MTTSPDALLDGLTAAQRRAVTTEAAPLVVLAGAGSGKTRVLTRRIAHRVATGTADAAHVLALTFTRKAADELGGRLGALGVRRQVAAGTFHSLAYASLRRRWADRGERPPALLAQKGRLLAPLVAAEGAVAPLAVAAEVEWAKARLVPPERYAAEAAVAGRTPPLALSAVAGVYGRYEEAKRRGHLVDFDDLLVRCAWALETDADFAAAQRWRFRHLFVDEFQDVNAAQARLLAGWLGGRTDLCAVGDPDQAIYSWNGADASYLDELARRPGAEVVRLEENFRSSPQVLAVAGAVLAAGGPRRRPVPAESPEGPVPTVTAYATEDDEAAGVARALRRRHGPFRPWSRMAVLVRTNAQARAFERALGAAGIPFRVTGSWALLGQPEVRAALGELVRSPLRAPVSAHLDDLAAAAEEAPEEHREALWALVRLGREFAATSPAGPASTFRAWLDVVRRRNDEVERRGDAVEVTTFHRAKGLEWEVVFLAGLEEGLVPVFWADTPAAVAEEHRLAYVACTRAERELHCSWARSRTNGPDGRARVRSPSPLLETIESARHSLAAAADDPADWGRFLAAERARLHDLAPPPGAAPSPSPGSPGPDAPDPDAAVLAALREWRGVAARAAMVAPPAVLPDAALAAVAASRPGDLGALAALPGVGPARAARHGERLLTIVAAAPR